MLGIPKEEKDMVPAYMELTAQRRRHPVPASHSLESMGQKAVGLQGPKLATKRQRRKGIPVCGWSGQWIIG